MPLTKQYLRYEPEGKFNITCNLNCNILCITWKQTAGRYVAVGAGEDVIIWDCKIVEKACVIPGDKTEVCRLATSSDGLHLAVGYTDGCIKVYNLDGVSNECLCTLAGHKTAVTCLTFNSDNMLLASGSKDTDIIIWDVVGERGKVRLVGHKNEITQVCFMKKLPVVITSSKDSLLKFWDIETGHCFKSILGHKTEVWDLALMREDKYLVSGSSESELAIWQLKLVEEEKENESKIDNIADTFGLLECVKQGLVKRSSKHRVESLSTNIQGSILACHANDNKLEVFYFNDEDESTKHFNKRKNKWKKKSSRNEDEAEPDSISVIDAVRRITEIECTDKIKACHIVSGDNLQECRIAVLLRNNCFELHSSSLEEKSSSRLRLFDTFGHRSDVKVVAFSSDGLAVASGSVDGIRLWNRPSQTRLRSFDSTQVYSLCFVPGDRHLLVGLDKTLLVVDLAMGDILEEVSAHQKEIWSIALNHDQNGFVTGSGDGTVKFWEFKLIKPKDTKKAKVLSVLHIKTLKLDEAATCISLSPDGKYVAVALLDSTVKIYFIDSLKFFLSLYGHKLPVLCMDISYDSQIICTGSADRNIKIWGLDFGDCHKSLFAHDDTITSIKFLPKTHYFFSCGKDGFIKQWDADIYERIQTLQGHFGFAFGLDVSKTHIVSCGSDRVIRLWARTAEPLVLEDEREEERAKEEEQQLATTSETLVPGQATHKLPSKKTVGAEKAAEQLLETLDIVTTYRKELEEYKLNGGSKPEIPPIMNALQIANPNDYLLLSLKRIRASDLDEALLLLPFSSVCDLLFAMPSLLELGYDKEVILRTLSFLIRVHHGPISNTAKLTTLIRSLSKISLHHVNKLRDRCGTNLHALGMMQRQVAEEYDPLLRQTRLKYEEKRKKQKQKLVLERAVLM